MEPITVIVRKKEVLPRWGNVWEIWAADNPQLLDGKGWWIPMRDKVVQEPDSDTQYKVLQVEMNMTAHATGAALQVSELITLDTIEQVQE